VRAHDDKLHDDGQLGWVRRQRATVPLMASVCTGSLVYAAAGLLSHRPATTHWAALDRLAELDPTIDVRGDERFVDDGDIITASGVSAGIDIALHLIVRLAGADRAQQVRRAVQYDPATLARCPSRQSEYWNVCFRTVCIASTAVSATIEGQLGFVMLAAGI
jgi:transcriptional regulator GlxA family with amidase domain